MPEQGLINGLSLEEFKLNFIVKKEITPNLAIAFKPHDLQLKPVGMVIYNQTDVSNQKSIKPENIELFFKQHGFIKSIIYAAPTVAAIITAPMIAACVIGFCAAYQTIGQGEIKLESSDAWVALTMQKLHESDYADVSIEQLFTECNTEYDNSTKFREISEWEIEQCLIRLLKVHSIKKSKRGFYFLVETVKLV